MYREIVPIPVKAADGKTFSAIGKGTIPIQIQQGSQTITLTLRDILHVPSMPVALILVSSIVRDHHSVHFCEDNGEQVALILDDADKPLARISEHKGLYPLTRTDLDGPIAMKATQSTRMLLLEFHHCMGHAGFKALRAMIVKGAISGIELTDHDIPDCNICIRARHAWEPFSNERSSPPTTAYGDQVYCDVWGPAPKQSMGGSNYYCLHIDDFLDEVRVYFMATKSDTFCNYKAYEAWAKVQRGATHIQEL